MAIAIPLTRLAAFSGRLHHLCEGARALLPTSPCRRLPRFAIVSLPRSGSTALYRVLGESSDARIAYEPSFAEAWRSPPKLERFCDRLFSRAHGIKHVCDPNGWPFTNTEHRSTPETLARSDRWIEVNAALLTCVDKVVVLRRRNELARTVSDLLGQQTDLWGHDPDKPHSPDEKVAYREQLRERRLSRLDERVIEWYLRNTGPWIDRILSRVPDRQMMTVYYEDVFAPEVDLDRRVQRAAEVGEWLGIRVQAENRRVRDILRPSAKINDAQLYRRIPNFGELVARYGAI